tara:strand:+ start:105 stop:1178 length:1074 start_codon:yes stop_codon:yes gene_type:complete
MAKETTTEDTIVFDSMPGGDKKNIQGTESFSVDLDFSEDTTTEDTDPVATEEQEVEEETTEEPETEVEEAEPEAAEDETETEAVDEGEETAETTTETTDEGVVQEDVQQVAEEPVEVEEKKAPMVPKSRLDEVLAKQKALQKQLDDLQTAKVEAVTEAPEYDFAAKEAEYQQFVLDGESEKAIALRTEIRNAEKQQIMFEVQQTTTQNIQQSTEAQSLQAKATELEAQYPVFDVNSAEHDPDLLKEALELRDAFMIQGYDGAFALEKAVNTTLTLQKPELLETKAPKVDPKVAEINKKKQTAKVSAKIEASQQQPPAMKGEGAAQRGDKPIDLNKLSEKEFSALPEETLKRLRGDFG